MEKARRSDQSALAAFEAALDHNPLWDSAKSNLARVRWQISDDIDGAIALYQDALTGMEDINYNHYNLGILLTWKGNREMALEHFKLAPKMLKIRGRSSTWTDARKMLVYELKKIGRREQAIEVLRGLVTEAPGDTEAQDELEVLLRSRDEDRA
jgi:tetratricopeptide (TPR) repeat protein